MYQKPRFIILLLCLFTLALAGCNDSSSEKKATVDPSYKGYPNGGLLAVAANLDESGVVILDARSADAYAAGHIPGALSMPWQAFVDSKTNLKPVTELETQLGAAGIKQDTWMIIYDDTTASWGAAGRLFWMFEYLGCENVRILDGGWDKWIADGNVPETIANTRKAATFTAEVNDSIVVDKTHIADRLNDADFNLVDTRTDAEFIGWTLYNEERGGHIAGAIHLPYEGYYQNDKTLLDYNSMKAQFDAKGVTPDKEMVAYCTAGIRSAYAYFIARLMDFDNAANYDASVWDWAAADEAAYPMDKLENYQALVNPEWVKALIDYHASGSSSDAPAEYEYSRDHKYLIFETQWGSFDDMEKGWADDSYLKGHIPGAIHSNSDVYENNFPRWFKLPDYELMDAVGSMGITADTTVVVYSNNPIFSARLWWLLKYAGVTDVRFLNGGYEAWVAAGYDGETEINEPVPVDYDGFVVPSMAAETPYVETVYNTGNSILADVRTYPEYAGETSGYSYVLNKGRIPGAVYAFCAEPPHPEYLNSDNTLRNYVQVRDMWKDLGIASTIDDAMFDKEVIFYCGSGYRSSLSYLFAYLMGYENVRNYSDGWEGWSTTYIEDPSYTAPEDLPGATDGWIQDPSGRPVAYGVYPEYDFDGYAHVDRLVDARWVKTVLLDNDNYEKPYQIVFTSWYPRWETNEISTTGEELPFATEGHIPGAIFLDTYSVETGPTSEFEGYTDPSHSYIKSLPVLQAFFADMGITRDTTVVVYADDDISMMTVGRIAWALLYAGVEDVRILNGSYNAWTEAGYPVETGPTSWSPVESFGESSGNPEFIATTEDVRNVIDGTDTGSVIVDDREWEEFTGESNSYYWWFEEYGRIPTARWIGDWVDIVTEDHQSFISFKDAEENWTQDGFAPDKKMYFYCGGGARSAMYTFYAYMMGWPAANYEGGWFLWSTNYENDRETGIPE